MTFDDPGLVAEFVVESNEHLADVENQLLTIESNGANVDVDLVNTVFRAVHSIKGVAGFLGLTSINNLAHSLENVLNQMRNLELAPTSENVDVMLRAADMLRNMINDVENSNDVDVSALVVELDAVSANEPTPAPAVVESAAAESTAPAESATTDEPAETDEPAATAETPAVPPAVETPAAEPAPATAETPPAPTKAVAKEHPADSKAVSKPAVESSIRVPVSVLDSLMNLAGELVLGRNQLMQTVTSLDKSGLEGVASRLDQVTSEMQEAIMQTRMQPIGTVFSRFTRVVRDLSNKLQKKCDLIIEGKEVEVDKSIIEAIGDPLTHLIRNSVDHGIEIPDERAQSSKTETGTIQLRAYHKAGKVRIDIQDDGRGINSAQLKEKAVTKGLITAEQAEQMGEREAVRLIFHPGFSTAAAVSDVSGRGVGMDVVRTNIERLGGAVDVETGIGVGTTVKVTLPLTLAIIPSLIVGCGEQRFAIPQINIAELVRVRTNELSDRIGNIKGAEVLRLRGALLPLVAANTALDLSSVDATGHARTEVEPTDDTDDEARHVIVVETGQTRYGLVVDELHDSEEIVVKPLGRHLTECNCLAGATVLGDGRVALILDVAGIAAATDLRISDHDEHNDDETADVHRASVLQGEIQSVLLFNNAPEELFAIPMSLVARIERIAAAQIDAVGGSEVLQYRGATLPVMRLEQRVDALPCPEKDTLFVIVFNVAGREWGLIASDLVDIRELEMEVDTHTLSGRGVLGSMVVDGQVTRFLDLHDIVDLSDGESNARASNDGERSSTAFANGAHRVMLAEDSDFFRHQVRRFLEEKSIDVVDYENGRLAWEALKAGEEVDLIITDVEMPEMNGFEFCERVKSDPHLRSIPVITLTSLAGENDEKRGRQAGADDYQTKMDRERLLASVDALIDKRRLGLTAAAH